MKEKENRRLREYRCELTAARETRLWPYNSESLGVS
jgi:hypothetical protein